MALPKFEDYKAPWEVDTTGNPVAVEDQELDPAKLKKHLWNILSDKEKAQIARDTNGTKVTELTTKVAELEKAKPAGDKPAEGAAKENEQIAQLMKLVQDMGEKVKTSDLNATKLTVISAKGLDPVADLSFFSKLETAEEIETMADTLVERGLAKKKTDSADEEGNDGGNPLAGKPPAVLNNGTPQGGPGDKVDVDGFIAQYSSTNPLF
jgi:polyhydroxyalkanoate synthesis regulator phasin